MTFSSIPTGCGMLLNYTVLVYLHKCNYNGMFLYTYVQWFITSQAGCLTI